MYLAGHLLLTEDLCLTKKNSREMLQNKQILVTDYKARDDQGYTDRTNFIMC